MEQSKNNSAIKNDYEFRRIYKRGKSCVNSALVVYILKNKKKVNRVGITTSKKIGNAVKRNRDRRIIREAYRHLSKDLKSGYDFVFVARARTNSLKTQQLEKVMKSIFISEKIYIKK